MKVTEKYMKVSQILDTELPQLSEIKSRSYCFLANAPCILALLSVYVEPVFNLVINCIDKIIDKKLEYTVKHQILYI